MNRVIKKVLKKIEHKGYEAFIVGGYVRDFLLDKESYDIDICTNALPDVIKDIFKKYNLKENYGCVSFKIKDYSFDITTYRKEINYYKRKPINLEFVKRLDEDLKRRDFTINSICMDYKENIIDIYDGINDLSNKKIKLIGDIDKKIKEDPLRILRAIRLSSLLNFDIDEYLDNYIKKNYKLINTLSEYRLNLEIPLILNNNGLNLLKKYKIDTIIDLQKYK